MKIYFCSKTIDRSQKPPSRKLFELAPLRASFRTITVEPNAARKPRPQPNSSVTVESPTRTMVGFVSRVQDNDASIGSNRQRLVRKPPVTLRPARHCFRDSPLLRLTS